MGDIIVRPENFLSSWIAQVEKVLTRPMPKIEPKEIPFVECRCCFLLDGLADLQQSEGD